MFKFRINQKVFTINNIKVGGQPGEEPTLLIGSIFYHGQKIIEDEKKGVFNKADAEKLILLQSELSDKTGNPAMLDVVSTTAEAMIKYIDFVTNITDSPFLIDSPSVDTRIAGLEYVKEVGLNEKTVLNSLNLETNVKEFEAIRDSEVNSAILLTYERGLLTSDARVDILGKLLPKADEAGITKPFIDTFVIDVPSLSTACKATFDIKSTLGLPCGYGTHNAIQTWKGLKNLLGSHAIRPAEIAANIMPVALGSDFILYGPVDSCEYTFPAVHTIDTSYKYLSRMKEQLEL